MKDGDAKARLYRDQQGRCAYCGHARPIHFLVVDSKWPALRAIENETVHLQLLCHSCRTRRGTLSDDQFRTRHHHLIPEDESIPDPPIPHDSWEPVKDLPLLVRYLIQPDPLIYWLALILFLIGVALIAIGVVEMIAHYRS